ncbi:hypothetical protein F4821DRAFT_262484 [Hypoxylon rubiginosum]|uniref:Uncharacterized protein n=1 Tax=Hypoxylon rubiginosum TaxID=110542 RepID=A0ACC0CTZ6_9PEZI|nr:hypothetical protein F4821DRAFT_262484 [Hypoxylon rubiginosum]
MSHNNNHSYLNFTRHVIARRAGQIPAPLGHVPDFLRRETATQTTASLATRIALTGTPFADGLGDSPVPTPPSRPADSEVRGTLANSLLDNSRASRLPGPSRPVNDIPSDDSSYDSDSDMELREADRVLIDLLFPTLTADGSMDSFEASLDASPDASPASSMHLSVTSDSSTASGMREPADSSHRHRIDNGDVSLFGDIREVLRTHVDADGNPAMLDLVCMICFLRPLEVPAPVAPRRPAWILDHPEWIQVLPCGHFFGGRCYTRWDDINVERLNELPCPVCRFSNVHPDCGHRIAIRVANGTSEVPLTIPEGGSVPPRCSHCDPNKPEGSW